MPDPLPLLLVRARQVLYLSQKQLAALLRSSERSVQRWEAKLSIPAASQVHALADAVRPHNASIAAGLDEWAPRSPSPVLPAALAPPAPPSHVPVLALVDSIVCAAAEAVSLPPQALRPALLAAFSRAREVGLTTGDVISVLAPPLASTEQRPEAVTPSKP